MLWKYLKSKAYVIIAFITFCFLFMFVGKMYGIPWGGYLYGIVLCAFLGIVFLLFGFIRYKEKKEILQDISRNINIQADQLPKTIDDIELQYQKILKDMYKQVAEIVSKSDGEKTDMVDYYTLLAHQIKTPIAALGLLLQNSEFHGKSEMQMELFKIEQYVDMVLQYLRLGSDTSDFLIKEYDLDQIIKEAVRKHSTIFIKKKISLDYEPVECKVITDEKWLSFVIGQVLSNSLKYTKVGKITISLKVSQEDNRKGILVIEDTGIGIQPEDLPRIMEKGYTGYNGRTNKKSTGVGLYLCKTVLTKLGNSISIQSEEDVGTKVKIVLNLTKV